MTTIRHPAEDQSNALRESALQFEPKALRTYTPTQLVIERSAGVYHWSPEGRKLYDFTSGVLVSNLGHNPTLWMDRFHRYMGWNAETRTTGHSVPAGYFAAVPMTAYNAVTRIESETGHRLIRCLKNRPGGGRLDQILWAASGSEAIQKALWAAMAYDRTRTMILATRYGFHGKKGLANAITGTEQDAERDPRVRFISFPREECKDVSYRNHSFDETAYRQELEALWHQFGRKIGTLITEPYLGGGGSYHPPKSYLKLLESFCRDHEIVFILDEVQANFGRTGDLFAYETYGLEPDIVVLGKGLGNGVPVAAAVGRRDIFSALDYGEGSDTWSANPLNCASVLATLDEFESRDILTPMRAVSKQIEAGLVGLKQHKFVSHVRGEDGGMVWGVEFIDAEHANRFILESYRGIGSDGVHLLGPLARKVVRISPPLIITAEEADHALSILHAAANRMD